MSVSDDANANDFDAQIEKWNAKYEKQKRAGRVHSMCLKCFRKRWPYGKYSSWQTPVSSANGRPAVSASSDTKTEFIRPVIR